jgi:predicted transcriptional regulator
MPHSRNLDLRRSLLDLSAEQLAQRLSILVRYLLRLEASALSLDNSLLGPFLLLGRVTQKRQPNADLDAPPNVRYWG